MYCTECGAFVPDTCKFCTTCGAPLSAQGANTQAPDGASAPAGQTSSESQAGTSAAAPSQAPNATAGNQAPVPNPYTPAPPAFQAPKRSNNKLAIGIIAGVAALVIIGTLIFLFGGAFLGAAMIETASSVDTVLDIDDVDDGAFADYLSRKVDTDGDGYISQKEADRVTSIGNLSQDFTYGNGLCASGVEDLDGIEVFKNLKVLLVCDNELESLDLCRTPNCALWTARAITLRTLNFPRQKNSLPCGPTTIAWTNLTSAVSPSLTTCLSTPASN
ncbi:putative uncharacterized protein [Collinsella sp. CAG:289]|nr:putative uncharacterized protein [Collinsella sp. CAG:289]